MLALDLFQYTARLKVLTFAIGVCVAFIIGSFAFANGLGITVQGISDQFISEGALAYQGSDLEASIVDPSQLLTDHIYASVAICVASINGSERTFFAVNDTLSTLSQDLIPIPGEMLSGLVDPLSGQIDLTTGAGYVRLYANHTYSSTMFPAYWNLVRWDDLVKLRPEMKFNASFVIFASSDSELLSSLRSQGLTVQEMTGILSYFAAGSREVTADLWLIIIPSSCIVALLVFSAMSMEAKDRARDIAILKAMGSNDRQIRGIFFFQALMLSILGAFVGILIGIIVSYGISTSSSTLISNSIFMLKVTETSMVVAFVSTVIAGLLGSAYPIYKAVSQTVREALI
jgi:ABC-type antimicrobial peptide transport system permease subunit